MTDDDDWVGTPPEGRYTRDRARPDFWRSQRPLAITGLGLAVALAILLIVLLA
ncbi:MAG TPA: hypothetical protein VIL49_11405 [Capillimicrobium sp.]|jgi:hypothetical protein